MKRSLSILLVLIMLFAMLPAGVQAEEQTTVNYGDILTYDFKEFAVKSANAARSDASHWWNALPAGGDAYTKAAGCEYGVSMPNKEAYNGASNSMLASLQQENWSINDEVTNLTNSYWGKMIWLNADPTVAWGLALNSSSFSATSLPVRARVAFQFRVEKAGQYQVDLDAWLTNDTQMQTGIRGTGAANLYLNDVIVKETQFFSSETPATETIRLADYVTLEAGINTFMVEVASVGRAIYLNKLTVRQIVCGCEVLETKTEYAGGNVHKEFEACVDCGKIYNERRVACTEGDELLVCAVCGGAMDCTHDSLQHISFDYKAIAKAASETDWWDALPNATLANGVEVKRVGVVIDTKPTEEERAAFDELQAWLLENYGWQFAADVCNFHNSYHGNRVYLCADDSVAWGLWHHAYYPFNTGRNNCAMEVEVDEAGWYQIAMDVVLQNAGSADYPKDLATSPAGGYSNVYVNGELVKADVFFGGGTSVPAHLDVGSVYLEKGVNDINIQISKNNAGTSSGYGGAVNANMRSMTLMKLDRASNGDGTHDFQTTCSKCDAVWGGGKSEPCADLNEDGRCDGCGYVLYCDHPATEQAVRAIGRNCHQHYAVCTVEGCGAELEGEIEACAEGEAEGICGICGGPIVTLPEDPRHIVMDFKAAAQAASRQSWWNDLVAATDSATKMVGNLDSKQAMTESQLAAYDELQKFLSMHFSWKVDETTTKLVSSTPKRMFLSANEKLGWGLGYYAGNLGSTNHRSELALEIQIPEGGEGWYNLTLQAYKENTSGTFPSYTNTYACSPGGGYADVLVNGDEIYNEYDFRGAQTLAVHSMGAVYLYEGANTVSLDAVKDYSGGTTNGRRSILLAGLELKPMEAVQVQEHLHETVDLRNTYLTYDAPVEGLQAVSANDWIAQASVNAYGVVTVTGTAPGETEIHVSRDGTALCTIPVSVLPFTGTVEELGGSPMKLDFMAFADRAEEQAWWAPAGDTMEVTADDTAVTEWLEANARWNLGAGSFAINGGNEKYGIGVIDGDMTLDVEIPAAGLYGIEAEYLREEEGNAVTLSVNDTVLYQDLSTEGSAVSAVALGSAQLEKGINTLTFAGGIKLRKITLTPLGFCQAEVGSEQFIALDESYLAFDADVSSYTAVSGDKTVVTADIDADGDLKLTGVAEGVAVVTVSGPNTYQIVVTVVGAGALQGVDYTVGGAKAATMEPGTVLEGTLTGVSTARTKLTEKQLRRDGAVYFKSTDTEVAIVDQLTGDIAAVGEGRAMVYAYALLDGVSTGDLVTVVVEDDTDLASIEVEAELPYLAVGSSMPLTVRGVKASGAGADMSLYPVTWYVDDGPLASVSADGRLTALEPGFVTVTAEANVDGMPVSDSLQLRLLDSTELPAADVIVDFTDGRGPAAETATVEKDGYALDRALTVGAGADINYGNKYGLALSVAKGDMLAFDVQVSRSGWYVFEITTGQFSSGAIADIFVGDSFAGVIDFYDGVDGNQYGGGGKRNTLWLDAGVHSIRLETTKAGTMYLGRLILRATTEPKPVTVSWPVSTEMMIGETVTADPVVRTANILSAFTLKNTDSEPTFENYYILTSSAPSVVAVSGNKLQARSAGTAKITALCDVNGEKIQKSVEITVTEGRVKSVRLSAEQTTLKPDTESVQLKLAIFAPNGNEILLPEGVSVDYRCEHPEIATVSPDGLVSLHGKEGSARVVAMVLENGREVESEVWITVTAGKTEPSLFTYEERRTAQENVLKYDWAWQMKEKSISMADYVVEHLDQFYDLYFMDAFPRSCNVGFTGDPKITTCRYCDTYLAGSYSVYPWLVDPINNPWKITCPACKRDFPSNDFGAYYASGLDENGNFSYDLADDSLLVNELYPEMGEGWGVDDGKGFFTKDAEGRDEAHTYIAYYVHCIFSDFGSYNKRVQYGLNSILPALWNAYMYTGEERYGEAGAIIINRLADVYPSYSLRNHSSKYPNSDGGGYSGKAIGSIWEATGLQQNLAQAADAFWPAMEDPDVIAYLRDRAPGEGKDPETITPQYVRENVENGILLEIKKAVEGGDSWGNFGMHQAAMTYAAVALDRLPETAEMIDWVFRYGERIVSGNVRKSTGGSVMTNVVDSVDRDGFGNEGSSQYNALWYTNLMEVADALSGYTRVEGADLWANPKFVNMVGAMMKLTMCGSVTPTFGESGAVQASGSQMDVSSMLTGFIASGNRDLAVSVYAANGNTTDGLHASIFTKDPEGGIRAQIQKIVNEEGPFDFSRSDMLCGLGLAALREGPAVYLKGRNDDQFSDWWMQFGVTGSTHSNLDSLNIGIDAFGLDLTSGLGYPTVVSTTDPERMQWVISTSSHNTVVVNDMAQNKVSINSFPLHFDDAGAVKLMDAEAPGAYADADIYRRTLISVDNGDGVSYGVDFFRILGGTEHVYSFHANSTIDPKVEGLDMVSQAMGTYAGPNIPFGFYQSNPYTGDAAANTGNGYSWLDGVSRDDAPASTFSIDWQIQDFHHKLATSNGIHLKLTMLSEEPMAEVALANGRTPQSKTNPGHLEYAMIRRSGKSDMDTLFTSVIEPYQFTSYIEKAELVEVALVEGEETVADRAAAVKVTLTSGREDYVIYATNTRCLYEIDGRFVFRGFAGVVSYTDGGVTYAYGNEAVQVADAVTDAVPAVTGTVTDFTKTLSDTYSMTVEVEQAVSAEELTDRYIYVANDRVENGAYRIYGAEVKGSTVVLDLYTQDLIRNYVDATDLDSGFIYNIAEGQRFTIPLSVSSDAGAYLTYTTDQVVKAGSKQTLTLGKAGSGAAYAVEGLPTTAKVDAKTGTITWTPSRTQTGRYPVTVKAVCDGETVAEMSFVIYVVCYTGSSYDASVCKHAKAVTFEVGGVTETVCPACGTITKTAVEDEPEVTEKFSFVGSNMTLGNELKLNFMVDTADLKDGYTALITHKGETVEASFNKYNSTYSFVSQSVAAKEMADAIEVV
ncbi:MAG: Ig-like domain-containing protein, partial [Oscillospiraceae bacterium]|nr:Ig-like domain-containing protein [Oscillospiraceae bacterium]